MNADLIPPAEREGRPAAQDLLERRAQAAAAIANGAFATARPPIEERFGGLRALRFKPEGERKGWMLQLHGGGHRMGRVEFEAPYCEALAARCGLEIVVPQFRQAPENPFPAELNDAIAAYEAIRAEAGAEKLIIGGDSAGGGLAAALALRAAALGDDGIAAVIMLSPWVDLTVSANSFTTNAAADPAFSTESAVAAAELYLQGVDPRHPLVSPLFAEITSFPPAFISVGTGEVLLDDARGFHGKLTELGLESHLCAIDGMNHVAVVLGKDLPGSAETFEAIAAFIDEIVEEQAG